jgi:enoyl-CoA hydratase/carnithine racemase
VSLVEYSTEGAVALITLNRPPVNALSAELVGDLDAAVASAADDAVRAVVVTGTPHFAAGADIKGFQAAYDAGEPGGLASALSAVVRRLEQLPKPVIAAVRGFALGGGLELAMGADFIYMAEDAEVGQPEITLGIIPGAGGTQRLYRLVGFALAKDLVYTGRFVEASEALAAGLARKVLPADELLAVAMADAAKLAAGPTVALAAAKRAMNDGWGRPLDDALAIETEAFAECFDTADAREGVAAFLGKRAPTFSGA